MRILLLGNHGQLGWELDRTVRLLGDVTAVDYPQIDLVEIDKTIDLMRRLQPHVIINATAYTFVDRAEMEHDLAFAINSHAPGILSEEAKNLHAAFIHYSTDFVFDGVKNTPYHEMDTAKPLSVYGNSKLAGEEAVFQVGGAHLIFRTSWLYSIRKSSFVTKVLEWGRTQKVVSLVTDQVGNPTWARMLAEATLLLLAQIEGDVFDWINERQGLYHLAGDGYASRYEFGKTILSLDPKSEEQVVREIQPAVTADFHSQAPRPSFSALDCSKFYQVFGFKLPDWKSTLSLALQESAYLNSNI